MTQATHTKGPWMVNGTQDDLRIFQDGPDTWAIAHIAGTRRDEAEQAANASLIAASPDLLAAVQDALYQMEQFSNADTQESDPDLWAAQVAARDAIAKAAQS